MDPLTTDQSTPVLHTAVIMDTLSLEGTQGSVVMVGSGTDQLPCVNVSESIHALLVWSMISMYHFKRNVNLISLTIMDLFCSVCLSLPPLTNGMISYSDQTQGEGTVATYSCNHGHNLDGDATRTCESNGVWTGSESTCQREHYYPKMNNS